MTDFHDVPVDDDTKVAAALDTIDGLTVRVEVWSWDGIQGRSVVFRTDEIESLPDDEVLEKVRRYRDLPPDESMTITRGPEFTFCNFGFETGD